MTKDKKLGTKKFAKAVNKIEADSPHIVLLISACTRNRPMDVTFKINYVPAFSFHCSQTCRNCGSFFRQPVVMNYSFSLLPFTFWPTRAAVVARLFGNYTVQSGMVDGDDKGTRPR